MKWIYSALVLSLFAFAVYSFWPPDDLPVQPTFGGDSGFETAATVELATNWTDATAVVLGTSDNSRATCDAGTCDTAPSPLVLSDFGFALTQDAITGIEVQVECQGVLATQDIDVSLSWDNGTTFTAVKTGTCASGTDTTVTYGASDDEWGHNWSPSEFNDGTLQVKVVNSVNDTRNTLVDLVQMKVYYCATDETCTERLETVGYHSWTVPTGVTSADIACWGAGGGGGSNSGADGGGGGGGGAFASSTVGSLSAGTQYTIFIGTGGAADSATESDSTFATTTVVADGGTGTSGTTGGAGGTLADSTGTVEKIGGNGGSTSEGGGGGGGGAGGPHGNGGTGGAGEISDGGTGGSGSGGFGGAGGAGTDPGTPGTASDFGGGGGGGGEDDSGGKGGAYGGGGGGSGDDFTGGAGGNGACTLTYTVATVASAAPVQVPALPHLW